MTAYMENGRWEAMCFGHSPFRVCPCNLSSHLSPCPFDFPAMMDGDLESWARTKPFSLKLLSLGHLSHQQETKPRKGDALISKGRKQRGYYSRRQLNIWLPEFKTMLMDKSLFLSHIAKQGSHESHGSRCSCFSATWRSSWCRHGALTVHYRRAASGLIIQIREILQ